MRKRIFFYSDPHFNHHNIIKYCDRPFKNIDEMNKKLINNYNKLVTDNDIVYFLGDLGLDKGLKECISKLKGTKILIKGNHDKLTNSIYYNMGFAAILEYATIKIGRNIYSLSHYPNRNLKESLSICYLYFIDTLKRHKSISIAWRRFKKEWNMHSINKKDSNLYRLHGHVHNKWKIDGKNINLSVDVWDFYPVVADKILYIINKGE